MKGKIIIDQELCKGCSYCIDACPKQIIALSQQLNRSGYYIAQSTDHEKCTGCAICATICPEIAITVYKMIQALSSKG